MFEKIIEINNEQITVKNEPIDYREYIEFLSRTDLGEQYPKEDFVNRIKNLVKNVQISLIARNCMNKVIGVCFGLTDFSYWLFISDLGVDKKYQKKGLGKYLVNSAEEIAGGEKKIIQFCMVNENAIAFYQKAGLKQANDIYLKANVEWTSFTVDKNYLQEAGIE